MTKKQDRAADVSAENIVIEKQAHTYAMVQDSEAPPCCGDATGHRSIQALTTYLHARGDNDGGYAT